MTVTLTYDDQLSRVRIAATSIDATVDYIRVERSTNQVTWTTVRGGASVPVSGAAASVDDYEFAADVVNYYRVTGVDTSVASFVAAGVAATDANAAGTSTVTPALPAGTALGDINLVLASIRNSGTGTVNTPTGYTPLFDGSNFRLFGKAIAAGEAAPVVSFTGGVANATLIAQCAAIRNVALDVVASDGLLNASAQNIAYPALAIPENDCAVLVIGWKQDDWTSVASLAGMTEIGEPTTASGDDAGMVWDRVVQTTAANISAGSFAVTGGASAISRGAVIALPRAERSASVETASITPVLDTVWIKSIARPFLNRPVTVVDYSDIERPARSGVFTVVGRSFPVAVNDVRGSRRWTLDVMLSTVAEAGDFDLALASGDTLFVHVPADASVPSGYVTVGDTSERRSTPRSVRRIFSLPCTEVAAPGPDVVGAAVNWQTVLNTYATWADVIAAHTTWDDLLELVGSPSDVIVP